jgi:hypothetical protein
MHSVQGTLPLEPCHQPFFALVIFWIGSSAFCLGPALDCNPPIYTSLIAGLIDIDHHSQFICLDGSC